MNERRPSLFLFRIVVWLTWMLAALGVLLYARHAWLLGHHMARDASQASERWPMLIWDAIYLLVAGLTLSAATGVLMWRAWARPLLRWIAWVLAVYSLATGIMLFAHWQSFRQASADLLAQMPHPEIVRGMLARTTHAVGIGLALKAAAAIMLAWLGWYLGTARMRGRFESVAGRG